jgi:hypothetical protein
VKALDFLIIGAQKCATTTLFELLRQHPEINMPLEKEVAFFTDEDTSADRWDHFAREQFGEDETRLWGKATPQYMCDPRTASRISSMMPRVKLIAILRDPAERSWSHYQMDRRRNTEQRSFTDILDSLLAEPMLIANRGKPVPGHENGYERESDFYVAWSEYGRILRGFMECFPPEQLLVIYTENLQADPRGTLDAVLRFLDLPVGFQPTGLGKIVHKGGSRNRIPQGLRVWLRQRRLVAALWARIPERQRGRWRFLYERWNVRSGSNDLEAEILAANLQRLREHYAGDVALLDQLPIAAPPWREVY